ncbi:hypothetical protein [Marinobacter sp. MBR-105]
MDDSIFRVAILSRPKNSEDYVVVGVTPEKVTLNYYEKYLKAKIDCESCDNDHFFKLDKVGENVPYLCFSGGFDSLSSYFVLGQANLISNDFGGDFKREADFFKKFDPLTFKWNLRDRRESSFKFNESIDWRFMLAPSLLKRKRGEQLVIATGTIMEASPFWWRFKGFSDFSGYSDFGFGPGVSVINPVSCLSEYLTTKLVVDTLSEEVLYESLRSLAPQSSLKRYRKEVLIDIVKGRVPSCADENMRRHVFGSGFGDDMVALYLVWKLGVEWVRSNYCSNIPEASKYLDFSFFERVNVNNLDFFDVDFRSKLIKFMESKYIGFFDENDNSRVERAFNFRVDHL